METRRLRLREFREGDFPFFISLEANQFAIEYEADAIPTQAQLHKSFDRVLALPQQEKRIRYVFLVERIEDEVPVGKVIIWQIDEAIAEWEMGWILHPNFTGQGYASEAARALIDFGFTQLWANRICANCNAANLASEKVMERIGMQKEGVLRQTRKLRGEYYDSCISSILRHEWQR